MKRLVVQDKTADILATQREVSSPTKITYTSIVPLAVPVTPFGSGTVRVSSHKTHTGPKPARTTHT